MDNGFKIGHAGAVVVVAVHWSTGERVNALYEFMNEDIVKQVFAKFDEFSRDHGHNVTALPTGAGIVITEKPATEKPQTVKHNVVHEVFYKPLDPEREKMISQQVINGSDEPTEIPLKFHGFKAEDCVVRVRTVEVREDD
jgi:hypothetical protein